MLSIKKLLAKILTFIGSIDDYVVETGTSGVWTYRKWNSGYVECVGQISPTVTWNAYATGLYYASFYVDFPFEVTDAQLKGNVAYCGGNVGWLANCGITNPTRGQLSVVRNGNSGSLNVNLYLTGKWK